MTKVGAIILAAGRSSRMGRNKMLEPLDGKAMLLHVVESVRDAGLAGPIIALGHEAEKVALCLRDVAHIPVSIPDYGEGMSRSLRGAVTAIPADWDASFIALGDMPFVSATLMREMAEQAGVDNIVVPSFEEKRGNPVLWGRRFFAELMDCQGDQGAKDVIARHASSVLIHLSANDSVLRDIDHLADIPVGTANEEKLFSA
jgi:molybdenum cofactor cytidylyltransferase